MKFALKNYAGNDRIINIPDGTTEVAGIVVSGDEILVYPVYRDPMLMERLNDYVEGPFHRVLKDGKWIDIDSLPEEKPTYEVLSKFENGDRIKITVEKYERRTQ